MNTRIADAGRAGCAAARWRSLASVVIALGIVMLLQPFSLALYTWSFVTRWPASAMFTIVSQVPDE